MKILLIMPLIFTLSALAKPTLPCSEPVEHDEAFKLHNAVKVINRVRHYTQGLVYHQGRLYESTGLYGRSRFYQVDPNTGGAKTLYRLPLRYFGEGLALLNGLFYQLTWQGETAFVYNEEDALSGTAIPSSNVGNKAYEGQGWGLTTVGTMLVKSDGSSFLEFLDPADLSVKSRLQVFTGATARDEINELEFAKGSILANIYLTQKIAAINPVNGCVTDIYDVTELYKWSFPTAAQEQCGECSNPPSDYVANGIAYDPDKGKLYLTGKNWPYIFVFDY